MCSGILPRPMPEGGTSRPTLDLATFAPGLGATCDEYRATYRERLAGMIARGEPAGADARAYWAGVRLWINGGNPYVPIGPFMPYV